MNNWWYHIDVLRYYLLTTSRDTYTYFICNNRNIWTPQIIGVISTVEFTCIWSRKCLFLGWFSCNLPVQKQIISDYTIRLITCYPYILMISLEQNGGLLHKSAIFFWWNRQKLGKQVIDLNVQSIVDVIHMLQIISRCCFSDVFYSKYVCIHTT